MVPSDGDVAQDEIPVLNVQAVKLRRAVEDEAVNPSYELAFHVRGSFFAVSIFTWFWFRGAAIIISSSIMKYGIAVVMWPM